MPDDPAKPTGPGPMPAAELDVDAAFLRSLVDRQFPAYRDRPIEIVANGWDNVVARVGSRTLARRGRLARRRSTVVALTVGFV